jgi:streptogramin lyase
LGLIDSFLLAVALAAAAPPKQAAPLTSPYNVLVEPSGTLLVADGASGRIVRVDPATGRRTVYARGLGHVYALADGPGGLYAATTHQVVRFRGPGRQVVASGFADPMGLAVTKNGTVYVVDSTANRVVRVAPGGRKTVVASTGLDQPIGAALTTDGSLLVADSHHGRVVRVGPNGALTPVLQGLALPVGVTAGAAGTAYVVDHVRHDARGKILLLRPDGKATPLSVGKIKAVSAIAVGRGGQLYAASFLAPFLGRLDRSGAMVPFTAAQPALRAPRGLEVGPDGALYVADVEGTTVIRIDPRTRRRTIAARGLQHPFEVAFDRQGRLLVGDETNRIFRFDPSGTRTLVAGNGRRGHTGDGGPATAASLGGAGGMAVDTAENLVVAEYDGWIRVIRPDGTIGTLAGNGTEGYSGDGGPAARAVVKHPHDIAALPDGSIVVADSHNAAIRRITPDGKIATVARSLGAAVGVAATPDGALVVADANGPLVRVGLDGTKRTLGRGMTPFTVAVAPDGAVYFGELEAKRVKRLDPATGKTTTIAP